ncbi:E3 ubiquitin-protein ligase ZNRF3 [Merluccius polli]|uniref:RING-type E3 ubiquitin transferase n=1 Tax=Merluccius polli TaxID=89951 RepID=A0AA47MSP4_MERPO|nr:E3 ubiquitin-protein ligase ZNRF3 [Merluccius polli]
MKGNLILGHYQAKRAVQRGATAVIFDVSENPDAIDQGGSAETGPTMPRGREVPGLGPTMLRDKEVPGLGPTMPRDREVPGLGPTMPRGREVPGLGPTMPRGREVTGLGPTMPRGREVPSLGTTMPRGREVPGLGTTMLRYREVPGLGPTMPRGSPGFRTHNAKGQGGPAAKMSFLEFTTGSVSTALSCEQLNQVGEDPLKRPVVYVKGNDAMKLMNIVNKQKVARARIQHRPPRQPTEYFDMGIFLAFFVVVSLVCLILLIKIKLKQRRSQSSLNRMAIQALEKMETRKFKAKVKGERESSCGVSDWLSSSSTSDCAICLEKYTDGEVRRTFYTKAHFNAPSNLIGRMDPHFVCRHCP